MVCVCVCVCVCVLFALFRLRGIGRHALAMPGALLLHALVTLFNHAHALTCCMRFHVPQISRSDARAPAL